MGVRTFKRHKQHEFLGAATLANIHETIGRRVAAYTRDGFGEVDVYLDHQGWHLEARRHNQRKDK